MEQAPKWFVPVAVVALLWNLLGCFAYLADVMVSPEALAAMTAAQQELRAARPAWSVAATAIAVWGGAAGCLGLIMRKRWAMPLLVASLVGCIVQDASFFMLGVAQVDATALYMQGFVLLVAIGLVLLARAATARGWIPQGAAR